MNIKSNVLPAVIFCCVFLTGCDSDDDASTESPLPGNDMTSLASDISGKLWVLDKYDDSAGVSNEFTPSDGFQFSFFFDSDEQKVGGTLICNAYGGDFLLEQNVMTLSDIDQDTADRGNLENMPPSQIMRRVIAGENASSSFMIELQNDNALKVTSRENEVLFFSSECLSDELIFTCP